MAKNPRRHPFNSAVIQKFVEHIEKLISSNPVVLSSSIQKHIGPANKSVYLKGLLVFIDSSSLDMAIFASKSGKAVSIEKYRFHYRNKNSQMVFRYDNAPHHPELSSFPDHKHTGGHTLPSSSPDLKDVLNEITAIILIQH